jgi:hydroxyacylglutathione hydrolase
MANSTSLEIYMFPCLKDNYGFLLHDADNHLTAAIDTPDANAIEKALTEKGWELTHILNTHHHWDHTGGNLELKKKTGCVIAGPHAEASRIPGIDIELCEGNIFQFGQYNGKVYDTPGHTSGHIVYHFENEHIAFVGDTLFAMGCGRLFEGTPEQMWHSLQKIMQWPDETIIYCAHEYTQTNARFALTVEAHNNDLIIRAQDTDKLRDAGKPTIPTTLALEKKTNPFLRPMSQEIRKMLRMENCSDVEVFARTRLLKDNFS